MGKQAVFYANREIIEAVNSFATDQGWYFVERIRENGTARLVARQTLDAVKVISQKESSMFKLLPQDELPQIQDAIQAFWLDASLHVELLLFLKPATGYDSRIWFQTPGHALDEEANALLRKIRKVIKAQENHALSIGHDSVASPS